MNTHHHSSTRRLVGNSRRRRGTIIVLVVAVLALLAVMGTIYIISARTDRASTTALNSALNVDFARMAAMNRVLEVVGDAMIDQDGHVGGYKAGAGPMARSYEFPDGNQSWLVAHLHYPQVPLPTGAPEQSVNEYTKLTDNAFNPSTGTYGLGYTLFPYTLNNPLTTVVGDQTNTVLANVDTTLDDPPNNTANAADAYMDLLPFSDASGVRYRVSLRILDTSRMANLNTGSPDDGASLTDTAGAYIASLRLAPAFGTLPPSAAYFNADPSTGDGAPSTNPPNASRALNLQRVLDSAGNNTSGIGRAGFSGLTTFTPGGWQQQVLRIEKPDPSVAMFGLEDETDLRSYGEFGTANKIRAALGEASAANPNSYIVWPATLCPTFPYSSTTVVGRPARRNYTTYSFSREIRPYADPDPTVPGSYYTLTPDGKYVPNFAASPYDPRKDGASNPDDAPWPNPIGFDPTDTVNNPTWRILIPIWPAMPLRINVNYPIGNLGATDPDTTSATYRTSRRGQLDAMFRLAMVGTNLATAMKDSTQNQIFTPDPTNAPPFTQEEIACFVANYCANRWNGLTKDPDVIDLYPAVPGDPKAGQKLVGYYFPSGPSFVDKDGLCIRTADQGPDPNGTPPKPATQLMRDFARNTGTDPKSNDVTTQNAEDKVYLGYIAQPFINEVAVFSHWQTDPADNTKKLVVVSDIAVELYNPYDTTLSLKGYQLKTQSGATIALDNHCVPAHGYLIISSNTNFKAVDPPVPNSILWTPDPAEMAKLMPAASGGSIVLQRPWCPRQVPPPFPGLLTSKFATVDQFDYNNLATDADGNTAGASMTKDKDGNDIAEGTDLKYSEQRNNNTIWAGTVPNTPQRIREDTMGKVNSPTGAAGTELYDRTASGGTQGGGFTTVRDFNKILRICHEIDPATGDPASPHGLITVQASSLVAAAPLSNTDCTTDAMIHFDFLAGAWNYTNNSPPIYGSGTQPRKPGDIRAVRFLEHLSFVDRVTDGAINVGTASDVDKLRLPGQVNVNTASFEVLLAIPNLTPQMVANIIGYRYRLKVVDAQGPYKYLFLNGVYPNADFDSMTGYTGIGIRSLSELMVPILKAQGYSGGGTLDARDAVWASVYNLCTVRSDTFVVYGFLEALKVHPKNNAHNNGLDWYGSVSDNVNVAATNLRVAKRRWVAIIDRSYCNSAKKQPQYLRDGSDNTKSYPGNLPGFTIPKVVAIKDLPQ